jgi:uncharacterized membrane protein/CBS domain-containing protein
MRAREIMTRDPQCIGEDETLDEAARQLAKHDFGAMPICGNDQRLKGMLTDRDLITKAIAKGRELGSTRVSDLAEGKPVTIGADDSLREAISTMAKHGVRRLPVIDGHQLVGIVSQADIARHVRGRNAGRLLRSISEQPGNNQARRLRGPSKKAMLMIAAAGAGAVYLTRRMQRGGLAAVEQSRELEVPVRQAYDQWTQFEEFPQFMDGVQEVRQLDDTRLHWVADVGGRRTEWDAKIVDQVPDQRISWTATSGKRNAGEVRFESLGPNRTKVHVRMEYEPEGLVESVGGAIGLPQRRVKADLERFRELIERRGAASGAWRGEVHGGAETRTGDGTR